MNFTFDNKIAGSVILWLDNRVSSLGQGYINQSTQLFSQNDSSKNVNYWASPYKSWIYDSSVTGAIVPSGFYDTSGNFLTRQSGLNIDFINGRVYSTGNLDTVLSGNYSQKEYNVYYSDIDTVNFYLERLYGENPNIQLPQTGTLPYVFDAPCIIVTNSYAKNSPFAFGGQRCNNRLLRLYVLSNKDYNQDALTTIILDSFSFNIPLIDDTIDIPINSMGDLKTGYYNYNDIISKYGHPPGIYIKDVYSYKLNERMNKNIGFALQLYELDLECIRTPGT